MLIIFYNIGVTEESGNSTQVARSFGTDRQTDTDPVTSDHFLNYFYNLGVTEESGSSNVTDTKHQRNVTTADTMMDLVR